MKKVLVATIGTRDVMFQISSGTWYNVGDDRMLNGDIIGEQAEVISDLGLHDITFRKLTQYLLEHITTYIELIKPVIIGKLLNEKASDIERVYLIATDQKAEVPEREKDTLYAAELIKAWIVTQFNHIKADAVEIITLGADGTNPSHFEQMFQWWRKTWREKICVQPNQSVWVCLKGGVGQASEASRISGLSFYGDRIQFFEFKQNTTANRTGVPSDYSGPFLGTNYLWDRTEQQALKLLSRYDYSGVYDLLQPYFQQSASSFNAIPNLVKAGIAWNHGEFNTFFSLVRSSLTLPEEQRRGNSFWWMAYEQAYLGVVRLEQQNTVEAVLHTHRAIEGLLYLWAINTFPYHVTERRNKYLCLKNTILQQYYSLKSHFNSQGQQLEVDLKGWVLQDLLEAAIPKTATNNDFKAFWETARESRNNLSHRLGGLAEQEVFQAWGNDVRNSEQWQRRILNCLNLVTGQSFKSFSQASLFPKIHSKVVETIKYSAHT